MDWIFFFSSYCLPRPFTSFFYKFFFYFVYFNQLPLFIPSKRPLFLYILGKVTFISVRVYYLFLHVTPRVCQMNVLPLPIAWPYLPWIPKPLLDMPFFFFFLKDHNFIRANYYCYCCCYFITIYFFKVFIFLNVVIFR